MLKWHLVQTKRNIMKWKLLVVFAFWHLPTARSQLNFTQHAFHIAKQFLKSILTIFFCIRIQQILKMKWIQIRLLLFIASECWWKWFTFVFFNAVWCYNAPRKWYWSTWTTLAIRSFSSVPSNIAGVVMMVLKELMLNFAKLNCTTRNRRLHEWISMEMLKTHV